MTEKVAGEGVLTVEEVEPGGEGAWDRFVDETEEASFCHRAAWAPLLSEVTGAEPLYRVVRDPEGQWEGVLPLFRVRSRLFGHYLVSVPFLNYGGPVGTPTGCRLLAEHAAWEAERTNADLLELRSRRPLEWQPEELVASHRKVTVVLDLPENPDALFREVFGSKLRSQIRRPLKEGMETQFGSHLVDTFLEVFQRNMRDLGTPVLPAEFFRGLPDAFGEDVTFGVVYAGETPVAAGCGFSMKGEFEMTWASSLREYNRQAPNMLLYWAFMERAIEGGASRFNFGRCTPGSGTHRFKRQWNGRDEGLSWLQWSPSGLEAPPNPDSGRFGAAIALWRRLPLRVANRLGPLLSRKIP